MSYSNAGQGDLQYRVECQEDEIALLRQRVHSLSSQLQSVLEGREKRRRYQPLSPHQYNIRQEVVSGTGNDKKSTVTAQKQRMGRAASLGTRQVLDSLAAASSKTTSEAEHPAVMRLLEMFNRPAQHMDYLSSQDFAKDLLKVASKARHVLEREPRVVFLQSPAYVFGDIHGNLEDLHFFSDNIWRLGMSLTAGNFLFLGDYVDRGLSCLETVSYLLAMKVQLPQKVYLLRGNHETRDVNGWEEHYGERSFIWQCRSRFGDDLGYRLWEACNQVFDRLPLAAVIDQDIFCVHGGIPRPVGPNTTRIQDILTVPKVAGINPPYEHERDEYQQVASDCIWSDPASEEQEAVSVDPDTGFGESLRGGGAICFGNKAVTDFLQQQDFSYIMRAHEAHAEGVAVSKGARVFTVFSTSQDHNQGSHAMAGCILVDNDQLQVINRSPAYKNQYVHRRDSLSLAALSEKEIQQRVRLGLVTATGHEYRKMSEEDAEEHNTQEWEDFDSEDEEIGSEHDDDDDDGAHIAATGSSKNSYNSPSAVVAANITTHTQDYTQETTQATGYRLASSRRSSIDLSSMSTNLHDGAVAWDQQQNWQDAVLAAAAQYEYEDVPMTKRYRNSIIEFEPIDEALSEEEEVATVNGDEVDEMEH